MSQTDCQLREREKERESKRAVACQIFSFSVGNVLLGLWIPVFLGESKVNDVHLWSHVDPVLTSNEVIVIGETIGARYSE